MRVQRYDLSTYQTKAKITAQGYLNANALATRVGVFTYYLGDGTIRRELRHPDDVYNPDSMRTLQSVAVTNDHPEMPLDSENTKKFAVGFTGESVDRNEPYLGVRVTITDKATIDQVLSGEKEQLSCGYYCDLIAEKGNFQGEEYDARQKNIIYNHLAVVQEGRAGPNVRVKLDSKDGMMRTEKESQEKKPTQENNSLLNCEGGNQKQDLKEGERMAKLNIDSVEYEVQDGVAGVLTAKLKKLDECEKALVSLKADSEKLQGRCDGLESELKSKKEEIEKVKADSKLSAKEAVEIGKARIKLEETAKKILGEVTVDAMDDLEIKKAVIVKLKPEVKLDSKDSNYIEGMFDIVCDAISSEKSDSFKESLVNVLQHSDASADDKIEKERLASLERSKNRWKGDANK